MSVGTILLIILILILVGAIHAWPHSRGWGYGPGGIVGVLGADDSIESHVRDTQDAGAGLVDEHTARFIAEHSSDSSARAVCTSGV